MSAALVIDESAILVVSWYMMWEHGKKSQLDRRNPTHREANCFRHGVCGQLHALSTAFFGTDKMR